MDMRRRRAGLWAPFIGLRDKMEYKTKADAVREYLTARCLPQQPVRSIARALLDTEQTFFQITECD